MEPLIGQVYSLDAWYEKSGHRLPPDDAGRDERGLHCAWLREHPWCVGRKLYIRCRIGRIPGSHALHGLVRGTIIAQKLHGEPW